MTDTFAVIRRRAQYFALLCCVRAHLRLFGMKRSIERARRVPIRARRRFAATISDSKHTAQLVEAVAAVFPGRARCLEQSLTLFIILRLSGMTSELRLGAQVLPFAAHAWVEVDGQPINSDPEFIQQLTRFPDLT